MIDIHDLKILDVSLGMEEMFDYALSQIKIVNCGDNEREVFRILSIINSRPKLRSCSLHINYEPKKNEIAIPNYFMI